MPNTNGKYGDMRCYSIAIRTRSYAGKSARLEGGASEIANSLTSVQKDSMIMIIEVNENGDAKKSDKGGDLNDN